MDSSIDKSISLRFEKAVESFVEKVNLWSPLGE